MKKFIYLIPLFFFFIFSINVSALDSVYEYLGFYDDEQVQQFLDEGVYFFDYPVLFSDNPNYVIEENITLSDGGVYVNYQNANGSFSQVVPFGQLTVVGNIPQMLQFTLNNAGEPLFSSPGTLNLHLSLLGGNVTVTLTRDGSSTSQTLGSYSSITEIDYEIDNTAGNLEKVQITLTNGVYVDGAGPYLRGGILKYGYLLADIPDEPEVEPNVPGDTMGVFNFLLSFMADYIESLFLLEIVTDVTFGYFLLAVAILGVIFSFLFSRMIK